MTKKNTEEKTLEVSKLKAKKNKPELSYEDALRELNVYDARLKEAGRYRIFNPPTVEDTMTQYHSGKAALCITAATITELTLAMTNLMPTGNIGFFICTGTMLGGIGLAMATYKKSLFQKAFSPLKYRKVHETYTANIALQALKEKEFERLETEILKKAKKPVKVIEKHLTRENRTLVYSGNMGEEGFSIRDSVPMNIWEKEILKATSLKTQALEQSARKELTA